MGQAKPPGLGCSRGQMPKRRPVSRLGADPAIGLPSCSGSNRSDLLHQVPGTFGTAFASRDTEAESADFNPEGVPECSHGCSAAAPRRSATRGRRQKTIQALKGRRKRSPRVERTKDSNTSVAPAGANLDQSILTTGSARCASLHPRLHPCAPPGHQNRSGVLWAGVKARRRPGTWATMAL